MLSPTEQICYNGVRVIDHPCLPNVKRLDDGALPMIWEYHQHGIGLDQDHFRKLSRTLHEKSESLQEELDFVVGHPVNANSGDQVAHLIFHELGLVSPLGDPKMTASNKREVVDDEVLSSLKSQSPIVQIILDKRQVDKLLGTYVDKLPGMVGEDGRLRTTFRHTVAATGRLASENPNLQNIPTRTKDGMQVRYGFVAEKDSLGRQCKLVSLDLSQIEMVLAGHLSRDEVLLNAFIHGADIHTLTAINCFRLDRDKYLGLALKAAREENGHPVEWLDGEKAEWKIFKSTKRLPAKCFHPDTEVLTRGGWKRIVDLETGEEVIQAIPEPGRGGRHGWARLEWVVPTEVFTQYHPSGKLIHLKNQGMDLRVTPDHRMLAWTSADVPGVVEAKDFATTSMRYWVNAGVMRGEEEKQLPLQEELLLRLAVAVSVAVQADGSINQWGTVRFGFTRFTRFTRNRKIRRLVDLLTRAKVRYKRSKRKRVVSISIYKKDAAQILSLLDADKTMPWSWVGLSFFHRCIILDEAQYWDGCQQGKRYIYSTAIRKNADVLQAIAAVTGRKSRMVETQNKDWSPVFTVSVKGHNHTRTGNLKSVEYEYTGKVACLSVPSSFVLVRDGGVPVICGQTVGFGILYGQTASGAQSNILAQGGPFLEIPEVEAIINGWFGTYRGVADWMAYQHSRALRYGMVWDMWGRTRLIPEALSALKRIRGEGLRQAGNMPIQSSAQGLIKLDMAQLMPIVEYFQSFSDVRCWPLLQIHDELIFELSPNIVDEFCELAHAVMTTNVKLLAPVKASYGVAERWGDLK
jgi:hypothetical protein